MNHRSHLRRLCVCVALLLCCTSMMTTYAEDICTHENRHPVEDTVVDYIFDPDAPDQHTVISVTYQYNECDVCYERFSGIPIDDSTTTAFEAHDFEDGVCTKCHYVSEETTPVESPAPDPSTCIHDYDENGICKICKSACEHPNLTFLGSRAHDEPDDFPEYGTSLYPGCVSLGQKFHSYEVTVNYYYSCDDCNQ